ncbi:hypothetical protein [Intestinimonas sp. MSJ-38]|uniref:hypothetical protein n=1 Tax=Intestinimonas sp. MSJ-38 TaxID=2841532 RepID=UPI0011C36986|nr:hypothetical protein [Intestinimonas sp. MSJ-38]MBU5431200.1 hypothetical protein [Intestinimonas sp. MSJ-38]
MKMRKRTKRVLALLFGVVMIINSITAYATPVSEENQETSYPIISTNDLPNGQLPPVEEMIQFYGMEDGIYPGVVRSGDSEYCAIYLTVMTPSFQTMGLRYKQVKIKPLSVFKDPYFVSKSRITNPHKYSPTIGITICIGNCKIPTDVTRYNADASSLAVQKTDLSWLSAIIGVGLGKIN